MPNSNPITAEDLAELVTAQDRIVELRARVHDRVIDLIEEGQVNDAAGQPVEHTFTDGRCCSGYGRLEIQVVSTEDGIEAHAVHVLDDARGPSSRSRTMVIPAPVLTGAADLDARYQSYVKLREEFGDR